MVACPFCELDATKVLAESELALAISDAYPVTEGHTLVVPRLHISSIYELDAADQSALWAMVCRVRDLLAERYAPDGFNIAVNDGAAAGQIIGHAHIHLIPRRTGDVPDPKGGIRNVIPAKARYWEPSPTLPTEREQIDFLLNVQQLLRQGVFTSTYKYALLMALADLSVDLGDGSGRELELSAFQIAEKFAEYYWRQTLPFPVKEHHPIAFGPDQHPLHQNTNTRKQATVVKLLLQTRENRKHLADAKRDSGAWRRLINKVANTVREMPLCKLQNVGNRSLAFLYDPPVGKAPAVIRLYPGVAFCFSNFRGLVSELVTAAWTRWVHQQNRSVLGQTADLHEFLFGADRASLALVRNALLEFQQGKCFYCHRRMYGSPEVDHFIPWALYPLDLGHNFVLAHRECNSEKRDQLASEEHLAAWVQGNQMQGDILSRDFDRLGVLHDITMRIAYWAYRTASAGAVTWKSKKTLVPLKGEWNNLLASSRDRQDTLHSRRRNLKLLLQSA